MCHSGGSSGKGAFPCCPNLPVCYLFSAYGLVLPAESGLLSFIPPPVTEHPQTGAFLSELFYRTASI